MHVHAAGADHRSAGVIVAGRPNKPNALGIWPGQDIKGKWAKRCIKFADDLGYTRAFVCTYWAQVAIALEYEAGRPREIAEDTAWHAIEGALFGIKQSGDCN